MEVSEARTGEAMTAVENVIPDMNDRLFKLMLRARAVILGMLLRRR